MDCILVRVNCIAICSFALIHLSFFLSLTALLLPSQSWENEEMLQLKSRWDQDVSFLFSRRQSAQCTIRNKILLVSLQIYFLNLLFFWSPILLDAVSVYFFLKKDLRDWFCALVREIYWTETSPSISINGLELEYLFSIFKWNWSFWKNERLNKIEKREKEKDIVTKSDPLLP